MRIRGDDVAAHLLAVIGAQIIRTRAYGDQVIHSYAVPHQRAPVLVGGPARQEAPDGPWWTGADVGR